jgi:hypothetical protein
MFCCRNIRRDLRLQSGMRDSIFVESEEDRARVLISWPAAHGWLVETVEPYIVVWFLL